MIKIMYFTDRLPGVTPAAFVQRWIQLWDLAANYPAFCGPITHYLQGDGVDLLGGLPAAIDYACVGEVGYPTVAACTASMTSSELAEKIVPDGDQTFGRRRWTCFGAQMQILSQGPQGPYKLYVVSTAVDRDEALDDGSIDHLRTQAGRVSVGEPAGLTFHLDPFGRLLEASFNTPQALEAAARGIAPRLRDGKGFLVAARPRVLREAQP